MPDMDEVQRLIDERPTVVLVDFDKLSEFAKAINDGEAEDALDRVWELVGWYVKVEKVFIPDGEAN